MVKMMRQTQAAYQYFLLKNMWQLISSCRANLLNIVNRSSNIISYNYEKMINRFFFVICGPWPNFKIMSMKSCIMDCVLCTNVANDYSFDIVVIVICKLRRWNIFICVVVACSLLKCWEYLCIYDVAECSMKSWDEICNLRGKCVVVPYHRKCTFCFYMCLFIKYLVVCCLS